jgi:chromosome segregation ATPase
MPRRKLKHPVRTAQSGLQNHRRRLEQQGNLLLRLREKLEDAKKHPKAVTKALELCEKVLAYAKQVEEREVKLDEQMVLFETLQKEVYALRRVAAGHDPPKILLYGVRSMWRA